MNWNNWKALAFICVLVCCFVACDNGNDPEPEPKDEIFEARRTMIYNLSERLILPGYGILETQVSNLKSAAQTFTDSPSKASLIEAQNALKLAWLSWQRAAPYMFGPSESVTLRKALNTYPTDVDKINANIASGNYILGALDNAAAVGFPAIDYMLNGVGADTTEILSAYTIDASADQRKVYLNDLSAEIEALVISTHNAWKETDGNFLGGFTASDALGTDVGSSLGLIINAMDLHFQRFVRDGKVAIPAGILSAGVPRPIATEAYFGGYSAELLVESVEAYHRLFLGVGFDGRDGKGFHDYLIALGAETLANDIHTQFETTITAVKTLNDPLSGEVENETEKVNDVFLELQKIVVYIKADMASQMGVSITNQDNDGD